MHLAADRRRRPKAVKAIINPMKRKGSLRAALAGAVLGAMLPLGLVGCGEPESEADRIRRLGREGKVDALAEKIKAADPETARLAVRCLAQAGEKAQPVVREAMDDPRAQVRAETALVYPRVAKRPEAQKRLGDLARRDPEARVRGSAVRALGQMRGLEQMETLLTALDDPDPLVRHLASEAVSRIMGQRYELNLNGPAEKRRQDIARLRKVWQRWKGTVRGYYRGRIEHQRKNR